MAVLPCSSFCRLPMQWHYGIDSHFLGMGALHPDGLELIIPLSQSMDQDPLAKKIQLVENLLM